MVPRQRSPSQRRLIRVTLSKLQDSVNCIMVKDGEWYSSVTAAPSLPIEDLKNLQRNVIDLRDKMLMPSGAARRFSGQFKIR